MNEALQQDARRAHQEIKAGTLRGEALIARILAVPYLERDAWVDMALNLPEAPPDMPSLPSGAVPYLPAEVSEIIATINEAKIRPQDVFVDLGAGVGRVAILTNLLTGARAIGVELQPLLVECAARCAAELGLSGVSFIASDVRDVALDGSVFFLYAPFNGEMLRAVLRQLRGVSLRREIKVCAIGFALPEEPWLSKREVMNTSLTIYSSQSSG